MAKEAYYFSHDSNARHDPKITAMRGVYGSEGYGWWWMLVEMMREADGYKLDMQSKYAFNAYAMQLQCECNAIASFVHDCIHEFNLFSSDGEHFWSESLLKRMEIRDEKSAKARESAIARWRKGSKNANASKKNANAPKIDALKESKLNKKIYAEFVSMTEEEYAKLVSKHGEEFTRKCVEILDNYKGASKKKYASDYRAILTWVVDKVSEKKGFKPSKTVIDLPLVAATDEESDELARIRRRQQESNGVSTAVSE